MKFSLTPAGTKNPGQVNLPGEIEHIAQNATKHGDFSLRKHNSYCVSPGSIHPRTGQQYRVVINAPMARPSAKEICFWNSERVERSSVDIGQQTQIPAGKRNSTLASSAGKLLDLGMSPEKVKQEISEINEHRCCPPLSQRELKETIFHSIDSKWSKKPDAITRQVNNHFAFHNLTDTTVPPENWLAMFRSVDEMEDGPIVMRERRIVTFQVRAA